MLWRDGEQSHGEEKECGPEILRPAVAAEVKGGLPPLCVRAEQAATLQEVVEAALPLRGTGGTRLRKSDSHRKSYGADCENSTISGRFMIFKELDKTKAAFRR